MFADVLVVLIATIDVWTSSAGLCRCRVQVFDGSAEVELLGRNDRVVLSAAFPSAEDGLRYAGELQPAYLDDATEAA